MSMTQGEAKAQRVERVRADPYCRAVLDHLWEHGPTLTTDLREALRSDRTRGQQICGLERLERVGLIRMSGKTHARLVSLACDPVQAGMDCIENQQSV